MNFANECSVINEMSDLKKHGGGNRRKPPTVESGIKHHNP
jgi:hypothetical protein